MQVLLLWEKDWPSNPIVVQANDGQNGLVVSWQEWRISNASVADLNSSLSTSACMFNFSSICWIVKASNC